MFYQWHGRQRRCQEDLVSLPSGGLEKTTRLSLHHVAQHRPAGSETTPPYTPRSSRFGSEPPSVEDDVDVWCYAILELHVRNDDDLSKWLVGWTAGRDASCRTIWCRYLYPVWSYWHFLEIKGGSRHHILNLLGEPWDLPWRLIHLWWGGHWKRN